MKTDLYPLGNWILRKITPSVLDACFASMEDEKLMHFLGYKDLHQLKEEREKHEQGLTMFNKSLLWFLILDPSKNHKVIGWCGYHTIYTQHDRAEIGYGLFDDKHKQKGIMSEVLPWVLAYGFHQIRLHRIEAYVAHYNIPSVKLLKKFRFTKEGTLREHYFDNGKHEDSDCYSLLHHEFRD